MKKSSGILSSGLSFAATWNGVSVHFNEPGAMARYERAAQQHRHQVNEQLSPLGAVDWQPGKISLSRSAQVLKKIDAVLEKAGTDKSRILSATVYMADAGLKDEMNEAWMAWVDRSNLPTRTAVGAVLTPGTMVEITICAAK